MDNRISKATGMSVEDALSFADQWSEGTQMQAGLMGWRVVSALLAEEVRNLRKQQDALLRGEFICHSCGLRKDASPESPRPDF